MSEWRICICSKFWASGIYPSYHDGAGCGRCASFCGKHPLGFGSASTRSMGRRRGRIQHHDQGEHNLCVRVFPHSNNSQHHRPHSLLPSRSKAQSHSRATNDGIHAQRGRCRAIEEKEREHAIAVQEIAVASSSRVSLLYSHDVLSRFYRQGRLRRPRGHCAPPLPLCCFHPAWLSSLEHWRPLWSSHDPPSFHHAPATSRALYTRHPESRLYSDVFPV